MFKNAFSFNGRIRRLEYGLSYLAYLLVIFIIVALLMLLGDPSGPITNVLMLMLWIPLAWFLLARGAKRCHDLGNSGWWQLIPFYCIWMWFVPGEPGENEYGENPKFPPSSNWQQQAAIIPVDDVDGDGIIIEKE